MNGLRTAGRLATSWVFVSAGVDVLRNPAKPAEAAGWLLERTRSASPAPLPADTALVRANAGLQLVAGTALALGVGERAAATALIGSLVPTTVGGHAFWRHEDPAAHKTHLIQFNKNLSMLGGLLALLGTSRPRPRRGR